MRGLAPELGLSVASLFGYRNGKIPISNKGWSKLERVEQAAGIGVHSAKPVETSGSLNEIQELREKSFDAVVREGPAAYRYRPMAEAIQKGIPENADRNVLERIAIALERLVEIEEERNRKL